MSVLATVLLIAFSLFALYAIVTAIFLSGFCSSRDDSQCEKSVTKEFLRITEQREEKQKLSI